MDLLDLLDVEEPDAAGAVYLAGLEPRRRGRLRTWVYAALDLWCATTGGTMELSRGIDVAVRRRRDGALVMTIPATDPTEGAFTLEHLQRQFETMTPEEFRAAWGLV